MTYIHSKYLSGKQYTCSYVPCIVTSLPAIAFFSTPEKTSAVQPPKQLTDDSTKRNKVAADQQQQQQQHYLRLRRSSPPTVSHSPSHTLRDDGTVTEDGSPTAPTSVLYNRRDEALLLQHEVGEQITDGRSKGCCGCCRTM